MNEITTEDFDRTVSLFEGYKQLQKQLKIDNFNKTIELFNDFKQRQQEQKMRGLNDFNILTAIRDHNKEDLHSNFICKLLNPDAKHYQDDLFLKLFLEQCELRDTLRLDTKRCHVKREHRGIDIYITDGNKHIIIENKIWAKEQDQQIKRYIKTIEDENNQLKPEDLCVIYLSPNREGPGKKSLCETNDTNDGWKIGNNGKSLIKIQNGEEINEEYYLYRNIHYNKQIKSWLEDSRKEVANIMNLSMGISQYLEVIDKLYGEGESNVMELKEYIEKYSENKLKTYQTMKEISEEYPEYIKDIHKDFWEEVWRLLDESNNIEWKITPLDLDNNHHALHIRETEEAKVIFACEYPSKNFQWLIYGVHLSDGKATRVKLGESHLWEEFNKNPLKIINKDAKDGWLWEWYIVCNCSPNNRINDLTEEIIKDESIKKAAENLAGKLIKMFDTYKEAVSECNEYLSKKESQ